MKKEIKIVTIKKAPHKPNIKKIRDQSILVRAVVKLVIDCLCTNLTQNNNPKHKKLNGPTKITKVKFFPKLSIKLLIKAFVSEPESEVDTTFKPKKAKNPMITNKYNTCSTFIFFNCSIYMRCRLF